MKRKVYVQEIGAGRYRIVSEDPGYAVYYMHLELDHAKEVHKQLGELLTTREDCAPKNDEQLALKIAEALLTVEALAGVELLETKLRVITPDKAPASIRFNPDAWRNYGRKRQLRVMVSRPDKNGIVRDKFYRVQQK